MHATGPVPQGPASQPETRRLLKIRSTHAFLPDRPVFRVDVFNVPQQARRRFLEAVEETHRCCCSIPGLIEEHILERPGGPGASNIVTIAMWKDEATVRHARSVVGSMA